jgi:hypothetical protein
MVCQIHFRSHSECLQHYQSKTHRNVVNRTVCRLIKENSRQVSNQKCESESNSDPGTIHDVQESKVEGYRDIISIFLNGGDALKEEIRRMNRESTQIQEDVAKNEEKSSTFQLSIQEQGTHMGGMKTNMNLVCQDSTSFIQILDDLRLATYDGTFIWRINKFSEKSRESFDWK